MKKKILYLSYNGMMEPLGASQVLSYLFKLSSDYEYFLISLEKPEDLANVIAFEELKLLIASYGIHWFPVAYQTSKIGKRINLIKFIAKSYQVVKNNHINAIHCRSYFPAIAAYLIKKVVPVEYLFDTRGFDIDERADVGAIRRDSIIYSFLKWLEKKLYQNANGINMLSDLGKATILNDELFTGGRLIKNISVIPTCVDLDRFTFRKFDYEEPITIGYVGTVVGWYDFDKTIKTLAKIMSTKKVKFLVFNSSSHELIKNSLLAQGILPSDFKIEKVAFSEMPNRIKEMDITLFFIHPYFSKRASAATKLGEFLATGIPVLTNAGVGDHEYYINTYGIGKIIDFNKLDEYDFDQTISELLNEKTAIQCRMVSEKYFSLTKGANNYKKVYQEIFNS